MTQIDVLSQSPFKSIIVDQAVFTEVKRCPICSSDREQLTLCEVENATAYSWCVDCSHMYVSRRPSQQWYIDFYKSDYDKTRRFTTFPGMAKLKQIRRKAVMAFDAVTNRKEKICDEIPASIPNFCSPVLNKGQKILEIGCGYGFALRRFNDLGYKTYGIEGSQHRADFVSSFGIPAKNVAVEHLDAKTFDTKFDLAFSNHVLEHIADPNVFMDALKRVLDDGKFVCITVPNFFRDFLPHSFNNILHIHCFSPKSLVKLLKKHGFVTRKIAVDHQIRVLAERTTDETLTVYPAELASIDPEDLAKYVGENLLPGAGLAKSSFKNGSYVVQYGIPDPDDFNFSRTLDMPFAEKVWPVAKNEIQSVKDGYASLRFTRQMVWDVKRDGAGLLPIKITYKDGKPNEFFAEW